MDESLILSPSLYRHLKIKKPFRQDNSRQILDMTSRAIVPMSHHVLIEILNLRGIKPASSGGTPAGQANQCDAIMRSSNKDKGLLFQEKTIPPNMISRQ